ncbi:M56 family metallopeptidase [Kitasatospora aureofaciens]|uniref:M56 family metallopeptidase n=1 Tax=Kitasatospora aureofaciens TaxID=1894 RepID=UPI001C44298F|nr:M56 family metallopeptidase [Kitasatospora aureofaciens]MBV6696874.1 M56 family metallopeptidase [Kitasatospora aureofaciens]
MYFTVYLLLLAPAALAVAGPAVSRHLAPAAAVRVLTCLVVTAGTATVWGLSALAVAGLVNVPQVRMRLRSDPKVLAAADPVPWGFGVLAAAVLGVVVVRLLSLWWRRVGDRRVLGPVRAIPAAGDLIVVADEHADAYALPGRPGRIVVTAGMLRTLSAEERAVLLAHERAHLTCRHHRYAAVAQFAVLVNPLLGRLRDEVAFGIERWADEVAVEAVSSRRIATRALARAALATACLPASPTALAYLRHRITARVAALQGERPVSRWHRVWPAVGAVFAISVALADVGVALVRCLNALAL